MAQRLLKCGMGRTSLDPVSRHLWHVGTLTRRYLPDIAHGYRWELERSGLTINFRSRSGHLHLLHSISLRRSELASTSFNTQREVLSLGLKLFTFQMPVSGIVILGSIKQSWAASGIAGGGRRSYSLSARESLSRSMHPLVIFLTKEAQCPVDYLLSCRWRKEMPLPLENLHCYRYSVLSAENGYLVCF